MAIKPYGICSDIHMHSWNAFSTVLPDGTNSRLGEILAEIKRCGEAVRKAGGDRLYIAGDVFHVRGSIAPLVLNPAMDCIEELVSSGIDVIIMPGNHDAEKVDVTRLSSAVTAMAGTGATVISEPRINNDVYMVPWIPKIEALKLELESVKPSDRAHLDLIIHFGVDGVLPGLTGHHLSPAYLKSLGYRRVFAGHYHNHKSFGDGIYSIGALTHQTWSDIGSHAGFCIVYPEKTLPGAITTADLHGVEWHSTQAPKFIEVDSTMDPTDILLMIPGNYVRAKVNTSNSKEIEDLRDYFLTNGAKGVVIISQPPAAVTRTTATVSAGSSIETSIEEYIKEGKFPDEAELAAYCRGILNEVRMEGIE